MAAAAALRKRLSRQLAAHVCLSQEGPGDFRRAGSKRKVPRAHPLVTGRSSVRSGKSIRFADKLMQSHSIWRTSTISDIQVRPHKKQRRFRRAITTVNVSEII